MRLLKMHFSLVIVAIIACFINVSDSSDVTVVVDLDEGDDDLCMSAIEMVKGGMNSYPKPCASLNFAIRGNISRGNTNVSNCSDDTSILVNVKVLLRSGVHQLTEQLVLGKSKNITFQADTESTPIVKCAYFPNTGNYDNIFGCQVDGLVFEGITFQECGPISSNVFIYSSSNIKFDSCTFR